MHRISSVCIAAGFLSQTLATGVVEFPLSKRDASGAQSDIARGMLVKRDPSTVEESVYDVLTWSNGGAYYTNGSSPACHLPIPTTSSILIPPL